jgi:hypothetical protein
MSWYYYLESKISFPFQARCVAAKDVSPLRKGETTEVVRMAAEHVCEHDMLVQIRWQGGRWPFRSRNWPPSIQTNQLRKPSATGITGSPRAAFSEAHVLNEDIMARRQPASKPSWTDVKAALTSLDRLGLLGLIQDIYASHKDNQTFLHARFGLGADVLKPYKETLDRWLWPDVLRNQDTSVVKAKQAISSYRKAVGEPAGLAELMVFYCECAAGFCSDIGYQDDGYFDALVRMFEQALKAIAQLSAHDRRALIARLDKVRAVSHNFGYGVGDDMDSLLAKYVRE